MSAYFLSDLHVVQVAQRPKAVWKLMTPLVYSSDVLGTIITVPEDFRTDFASVPRLPIAFLFTGGKADAAAVVHDWLYSTRGCTRKQADDTFYEAVRAIGHSQTTAFLMWAGVRLGGWMAWNRDNLPQTIPLDNGF